MVTVKVKEGGSVDLDGRGETCKEVYPEGEEESGERIGSAKKIKRLGPLSPKQVQEEW